MRFYPPHRIWGIGGGILLLAFLSSSLPAEAKATSLRGPREPMPTETNLSPSGLIAQGTSQEKKRPQTSKSIPQARVLTDVLITTRTDLATVELRADGPIPEGQGFRLDDPPRLVIDLPKFANSSGKKKLHVGHRFLKEVRIGQHEDKVRLVFTFPEQKAPPIQMVREGQKLRVIFGVSREAEIKEKKPLPTEPSKTVSPTEKEAQARPSLSKDQLPIPAEKPLARPSAAPAEVKIETVVLPPKTEIHPPLAPARPASSPPEPTVEAKVHRPEIRPVPLYRGEKVSLDFRDADLRQVFGLISQVSKRRIIMSDDIREQITIRLLDVPWDEALDIILEHMNLRKFEEGNIIRISRN